MVQNETKKAAIHLQIAANPDFNSIGGYFSFC